MVRFSCEKTLLQQAVNAVSRAVAAKSSIPALEGILLETEHGLRLSGYNMQTGIRTEVEADIRESGRIVLNAKLFGDMIRRMPDDMVVFDADEKFNVKLTCGDTDFEMIGLSANDYPEMPEVDDEYSVTLERLQVRGAGQRPERGGEDLRRHRGYGDGDTGQAPSDVRGGQYPADLPPVGG